MYQHYYTGILLILAVVIAVGCQPGTSRSPKIKKIPENPEDIPARIGYVNDYADMMSDETKNRLETRLKLLNEGRSVEFILVCVMTTGNRGLENYSMDVANKWNINPKNALEKKILMLIARDDKNYRANVSTGLVEEFPDDVLDELYAVRSERFNESNFDDGIEMFVESVIARMAIKAGFTADTGRFSGPFTVNLLVRQSPMRVRL